MLTMKAKILIYGVLVCSIGIVFFYQEYQLDKMKQAMTILSDNNTKLQVSTELQKSNIQDLQLGLANTIILNNTLAESVAKANKERDDISQQINEYRNGRLKDAAIKKPGIIQLRANSATANILQQFAAETGSSDSSDQNREADIP